MVSHVCGWSGENRIAKCSLKATVDLGGSSCVGWGKAGDMEMVSWCNAFKEIFRDGAFFCLFALRNRVEGEWLI